MKISISYTYYLTLYILSNILIYLIVYHLTKIPYSTIYFQEIFLLLRLIANFSSICHICYTFLFQVLKHLSKGFEEGFHKIGLEVSRSISLIEMVRRSMKHVLINEPDLQ